MFNPSLVQCAKELLKLHITVVMKRLVSFLLILIVSINVCLLN